MAKAFKVRLKRLLVMELGRGTRNTFLILFDAFCPLCAGESCTSERGLTPKGLQLVGVPPPETFQWSTVRSVKVLDATAKASEKYSKHASPIYQSNCIIMICFSGQGCVNVLGGGGGVLPMALKHLVIRPSVCHPLRVILIGISK